MSLRTDFIKQYTALPDRRELRNIVFGMWITVDSVNIIWKYGLETTILKHTIADLRAYLFILLMYDFCGLIFVIFPKKTTKYIDLYTAFGMTSTSFYLLYWSYRVAFLEFQGIAVIFTVLSLIVYVLVIFAMIKNVQIKMRKGVSHVIRRGAFAIGSAGGAIGITLARMNVFPGDFPLVICTFALACCFALPATGFHKFYLINKMIKEGLEVKDFVQKSDKLKQKEKNS